VSSEPDRSRAMFYFAYELLDYGRRGVGRKKVVLAGTLVSEGLVCATLRRDAAPRSRHLMVGGASYLAFLVAAVFAVI
jgi:hypothetical protein